MSPKTSRCWVRTTSKTFPYKHRIRGAVPWFAHKNLTQNRQKKKIHTLKAHGKQKQKCARERTLSTVPLFPLPLWTAPRAPPSTSASRQPAHTWLRVGGAVCKASGRGSPRQWGSLTFVPGPAANERRPREKAEEGGWGVGAQPWSWVPPAEDGPAHLPTHRLPKRRSARPRVRARERTWARACARRPRSVPPSSLPLRGEPRTGRGRS